MTGNKSDGWIYVYIALDDRFLCCTPHIPESRRLTFSIRNPSNTRSPNHHTYRGSPPERSVGVKLHAKTFRGCLGDRYNSKPQSRQTTVSNHFDLATHLTGHHRSIAPRSFFIPKKSFPDMFPVAHIMHCLHILYVHITNAPLIFFSRCFRGHGTSRKTHMSTLCYIYQYKLRALA